MAIIDHLAVAVFDEAAEARFRRWLADDALPREFAVTALDEELSAWFARSRVARPGAYRLGRILRSAQAAHDDAVLQRVADGSFYLTRIEQDTPMFLYDWDDTQSAWGPDRVKAHRFASAPLAMDMAVRCGGLNEGASPITVAGN